MILHALFTFVLIVGVLYIYRLNIRLRTGQVAAVSPIKEDISIEDGVKIFNAYREYMSQEGGLINFRMTWLIGLNGFLFATAGLLLQKRFDLLVKKEEINLILQIDIFLVSLFIVALAVSALAAHSIRDAKIVARTLIYHFESSFHINYDGKLKYISIGESKLRLPLIAGAGMSRESSIGSHASTTIPWILTLAWYVGIWHIASFYV